MKKFIILLIVLASAFPAWGWDNEKVHPDLTDYVANRFFASDFIDEYYNLGSVTHTVRRWLREGAIHEDDGTFSQFINGTARSINHFHDPTITNPTKAIFETAGLSDRASGMSAILWAQTGAYQNEMGWEDWSWSMVREHAGVLSTVRWGAEGIL
jgi:hypothetical protein